MDDQDPFRRFRIELDAQKVEELSQKLRDALDDLSARARERIDQGLDHGRFTKVRISYKGRQIGPDLPLAAVLAGEGAALLVFGPLRAVLATLGARMLLDVELVHEADELVLEGQRQWAAGEAEAAERAYREALARRKDDPSALYHLGVVLRVSGRLDEARDVLSRAAMGPGGHPDVVRAAELLERLAGKRTL